MINQIAIADARTWALSLPPDSVDCIITSPPYFGLRDYGNADADLGSEPTPILYATKLSSILGFVGRALKPTGTLWLNLGDSYSLQGKEGGSRGNKGKIGLAGKRVIKNIEYGRPAKNLLMIPARVALYLQDAGWYLRAEIIWHKPNGMPESAKDRPTRSHEMIYLLSKSPNYYYNEAASRVAASADSIARLRRGRGNHKYTDGASGQKAHTLHQPIVNDPLREVDDTANLRDVWSIPVGHYTGAHCATMPLALAERMVLLGCPYGGVVADPFMGAGTTAVAAATHGRHFVGCDMNPDYVAEANNRLCHITPTLFDLAEVG